MQMTWWIEFAVGAGVGVVISAIVARFWARAKIAVTTEQLAASRRELETTKHALAETTSNQDELKDQRARLETTLENERSTTQEKLVVYEKASRQFQEAFGELASDALRKNNQSFIDLAKSAFDKLHVQARGDLDQRREAVKHLVQPLQKSIEQMNAQITLVEKTRKEDYGSLSEQARSMADAEERLRRETGNLVKALRTPDVRGRWGEIQLKRVVEMSGMLDRCDFYEQPQVSTEEGQRRPDLLVQLPGEKQIVVDAKAPLQAYLEALEAEDDKMRQEYLKDHARQIRTHMMKLGAKAYWRDFDPTPEFVVMFLPGECFFSAALEQDPLLIEEGVDTHVILATPTTLIALLRTVHYGWQQEKLAENAKKISNLAKELYDRIAVLAGHFSGVGSHLDKAVDAYNKTAASFESRVLVSARKFKEIGIESGKDIQQLEQIDKQSRRIEAPATDHSEGGL